MKTVLQGGLILAELTVAIETENYSEEKKRWEVGSEVGHVASKCLMQLTAAVAVVADA